MLAPYHSVGLGKGQKAQRELSLRQDLEREYHDAGQFYCFRTEAFRKNRKLMLGKILPYVVSETEVQDIDNETDWQIAELKYQAIQQRGTV